MNSHDRDSPSELSQIESTIREHQIAPREDLELPVLPDRADRLLGVLAMMGASVCEFDATGHMIYASPQIEGVLGMTPEECMTTGSFEFHPDDLPQVVAISKRVRATGKVSHNETRMRHKQGHWVWVETTLIGWLPSEDGGFHTLAMTRDITELKLSEAARSDSESRYRVVSEMSCDLIAESEESGRQTYIGPGTEEILGYTNEEIMALEPFALIHPEDVEDLQASFKDAYRTSSDPADRNPTPMAYRIRHRDGRWLWFETTGVPYQRTDGEVRFLSVSRNVTDQKLVEQARLDLEQRMQRAQRLESLGVLAGGIAHDFNNILTPVLGEAGLGLQDLPEDSPVRERFRKIQQAATRAAALTNQMLAYAGQEPMRVERLDVSTLVREIRELLESSISGRTTLELELEDDLPAIDAEAAQLSQVVMNLITNAAESLPDGDGRIRVSTGVLSLDEPPPGALFAETMSPGRHVYIEVTDTGCGMDEETSARIFEPFFSTKFTGRGLGLAAVAGIVRGHHGAIEVESRAGSGTRFRVLLPIAEARKETAAPAARKKEPDPQSVTVLVVDDDDGVREFATDTLRRAGIQVLTASDGHEGLKLFRQHADQISVVLLDRTMPASSGADTLESIRALRPDAKVVMISGYSEERATEDVARRNLSGFLRKPFEPETLLERVREVGAPERRARSSQ
jgi:PAS domain S-box-containing protein